jgi:serine/threonine protein phosphatase PrpC
MENPAAMLNCSNTRCQAPNPQSNKFCQQCRTPLLRRYLWAIGQGLDSIKPGEMISDRYLVVSQGVLLETKPGIPPETPSEIPPNIVPYLRLSPHNLHIPQVYGCLTLGEGRSSSQIWLLEDAPLSTGSPLLSKAAASTPGQLLPELSSIWKDTADPMRQLNWLWQIAQLWEPLSREATSSSLLNSELVRVEGSIVRLLELQPDANKTPTLTQLGQYWSKSLSGAAAAIAEFFQKLCNQLLEGQIKTSEELIAQLDKALYNCGKGQQRTCQIFTATDKGPSRDHNEDACYPATGKLVSQNRSVPALAIVCDGIGGHEGGEVASNLAIKVLQEQLAQRQANLAHHDPITLTEQLELSVCAANDAISEQNDQERRSDRQRMGTTLVMGRTDAHEIYITHVGDSRVYLVTRYNCHQVTQDDDLASRELRLGYALYRNAVQQPASGSLVQALGMASSSILHPTVQRFVLDEDCVFLLCSDGLSDNDRVDQFWQSEILPILDGRVDLKTAAGRLIQIANTQNGHDNATIALIHCQVSHGQATGQTELSLEQPETLLTPVATKLATADAASSMKTKQLSSKSSGHSLLGLLFGILMLSGVGGVLAYLLVPGINELVDPLIKQVAANFNSNSQPTVATSLPRETPIASPSAITSLEAPTVIQVSRATAKNAQEKTAPLLLRRGLIPPQNQAFVGVIGEGSVLQVISKSPDQQQENWLQIRVCTAQTEKAISPRGIASQNEPKTTPVGQPQSKTPAKPSTPNSKTTAVTYREVVAGDGGWLKEAEILASVDSTFTPTADQRRECLTPTTVPTNSPTPKPS